MRVASGRLFFFIYEFLVNTEHFGALFVKSSKSFFKKQTDQPMNQIPYFNPTVGLNFPEDTILKDKDHAGGWTDYYVFVERTLVRVKRVNWKGPHYREIRELKEKYGDNLKVRSGWWNPVKYRIDDSSYDLNIDTPAEFVEMKPWEARYA